MAAAVSSRGVAIGVDRFSGSRAHQPARAGERRGALLGRPGRGELQGSERILSQPRSPWNPSAVQLVHVRDAGQFRSGRREHWIWLTIVRGGEAAAVRVVVAHRPAPAREHGCPRSQSKPRPRWCARGCPGRGRRGHEPGPRGRAGPGWASSGRRAGRRNRSAPLGATSRCRVAW